MRFLFSSWGLCVGPSKRSVYLFIYGCYIYIFKGLTPVRLPLYKSGFSERLSTKTKASTSHLAVVSHACCFSNVGGSTSCFGSAFLPASELHLTNRVRIWAQVNLVHKYCTFVEIMCVFHFRGLVGRVVMQVFGLGRWL